MHVIVISGSQNIARASSRVVRLAAAQLQPRPGDRAANLARLREVVEEHGPSLDLIVFPELYTTGYDLDLIRADAPELAEPVPGPTTELAVTLAAANDVTLALTLLEAEDDRLHDTTVVVTGDGVAGTYRKTHLYPAELPVFSPGNGLEVVAVDGIRLGPMICFEHAFPEVATSLALLGAEVLLIPSAVPRGYEHLLTLRTRARAQDNQTFVVAANLVDDAPGGFCGLSMIAAPDGRVLAQGPPDAEAIVAATVDLAEIETERDHEPALRMRRPALYEASLDTTRGV